MLRYNTDAGNVLEGYIGGAWTAISGTYTYSASYLIVAGGGGGGKINGGNAQGGTGGSNSGGNGWPYGNVAKPGNGVVNTGGGGGGSADYYLIGQAGNGASGITVVRYPITIV